MIELETAPTPDARAQLEQGQRDVLAPRYETNTYRLVATQRLNPPTDQTVAAALNTLLDANGEHIDGVLAASDAIAQASLAVLGQTPAGRQGHRDRLRRHGGFAKAMLRGEQFMTVYIPPAAQATAAADLAKALATGDQAAVDRLTPPAPAGQPRIMRVAPASVTLDTINQVFNSGAVDSGDVCSGDLALRCNQLSIP